MIRKQLLLTLALLFLSAFVTRLHAQDAVSDGEDVFGDAEEWNANEFDEGPEFNENDFGTGADATAPKSSPKPKAAPKEAAPSSPQEAFDDESFDSGNESGVQASDSGAAPSIQVTGIKFQPLNDMFRIVVEANGPMDFDQESNEKDKQVVVIVKNAGLNAKVKRRVDTTEFNTPVLYVSAVDVTRPYPGVRIIMKLRQMASANLKQEGNLLHIDFVNDTYRSSVSDLGRGSQKAIQKKTVTLEDDSGLHIGGSFQEVVTGPEKFYGKPIAKLVVKDEDITDVLAIIAEYSGYNVVSGDDVTGKVTVQLTNVPWDQALSIILKSKGLGYVRSGNVLRVAKIDTFRAEKTMAAAAIDANQKLEPIRTTLIPVSYGQAKDYQAQVKDFLSPRGTVNVNERTNTVVVRDTEENILRVQKLIQTLDTQTPQVIIEARLIEASKTFSRRIGMTSWAGQAGHRGLNTGTAMGNTIAIPGSGTGVGGVMQFANSGTTGLTSILAARIGSTLALSATLSLMEQDQVIKTITSPRIVTMDNKTAEIINKREETYTIETPVIVGGGGSTTASQTVPIVSETKFKVTPHITAEGSVFLDLEVKREYTTATAVAGQTIPDKNSRQATTSLLVENGETAIIGGFYSNDQNMSEVGIPWFRHIPLIGWLFRGRTNSDARTELVFFITPRVLNPEKAFVTN